MKTLSELSTLTGNNVVAAINHDQVCYHILIQSAGGFYKSYYIEGQKMGITLTGTKSSGGQLPFKKRPKFINNVNS